MLNETSQKLKISLKIKKKDNMDVLKDIKKQLKKNDKWEQYKTYHAHLSDMDGSKTWINAPAAFGDTYKYTTTFVFYGYQFAYSHCLADGGTPFGNKLIIAKKNTTEEIKIVKCMKLTEFFETVPLFTEFVKHVLGDDYLSDKDVLWDLFYFLSICMSFMINDVITFFPVNTEDQISFKHLSLHHLLDIYE
jgi:hypothetical protein